MVIDRLKVALMFIVWALFLSLSPFGLNVPTVLMVIGTILYLIP